MKLLLDENISDKLKELFKSSGFEILDLKEEKLRQLPDKQIVEIAVKERRIIITHDRDFLTLEEIEDLAKQKLSKSIVSIQQINKATIRINLLNHSFIDVFQSLRDQTSPG